jgi:Zn-dependent protease with chaperone function
MSSPVAPRSDLSSLVHPRERVYFALAALVGVLIYVILILVVMNNAQAAGVVITYGIMIVVGSLAVHGFMIGHFRGNAVRVSARQFPKVNAMVLQHAAEFGMSEAPDVFVLQSGGVLNAFATRFIGRNFVVLYSDILAMAEKRGEDAVSFVVAHELAHLKRGHLKWRWLLLPSRVVPFLYGAYSRACEYTCDRYGAAVVPNGAVSGLLALAAGGELYEQVEPRLFAGQAETEGGFWTTVAEIFATHPHLTNRVGALLQSGLAPRAAEPVRFARHSTSV